MKVNGDALFARSEGGVGTVSIYGKEGSSYVIGLLKAVGCVRRVVID